MQLRESQKKEDTSALNVRGVAKRCVFPMIRVSGESKSRLVKAAGAESCGQRRTTLHVRLPKLHRGGHAIIMMDWLYMKKTLQSVSAATAINPKP